MIDPQAQAVLEEIKAKAKPMPADQSEWLRVYRQELDGIIAAQGPAPVVDVRDVTIDRLKLRIYRPVADEQAQDQPWPTFLFIHGGGFVAGSLAGYDTPLRWIALRSGWQVVVVAYRLAPEHPFPAAPDDCFAALEYLAADKNVDPTRLVVGGDSAGGLLATVTSRRARDAGIPLALQVLLYPNADLREETPHLSRRRFDGIIVRIDELYRSLDLYCGATDRTSPDLSPLLAPDLAGLCPALLFTNEYDPLRDEAEAYGRRLRDAGVAVDAERLAGMIHGAMQRGAQIDQGDALLTRIATALRSV